MDVFIIQIVTAVISGAFAGGGAYMAIRVELKYLRRDVDQAHKKINKHVDDRAVHSA